MNVKELKTWVGLAKKSSTVELFPYGVRIVDEGKDFRLGNLEGKGMELTPLGLAGLKAVLRSSSDRECVWFTENSLASPTAYVHRIKGDPCFLHLQRRSEEQPPPGPEPQMLQDTCPVDAGFLYPLIEAADPGESRYNQSAPNGVYVWETGISFTCGRKSLLFGVTIEGPFPWDRCTKERLTGRISIDAVAAAHKLKLREVRLVEGGLEGDNEILFDPTMKRDNGHYPAEAWSRFGSVEMQGRVEREYLTSTLEEERPTAVMQFSEGCLSVTDTPPENVLARKEENPTAPSLCVNVMCLIRALDFCGGDLVDYIIGRMPGRSTYILEVSQENRAAILPMWR